MSEDSKEECYGHPELKNVVGGYDVMVFGGSKQLTRKQISEIWDVALLTWDYERLKLWIKE